MADERIIVRLASPERKYVKTYLDFLHNSFLSLEEQMVFIVLKSFIDFKDDGGEVFPSMETICEMSKMGEKRVKKNIDLLEKKGLVKKLRRGLSKTNVYTIADHPAMWACGSAEEAAAIADNQGVNPMTAAEHIAELERMGYKVEVKEKGLETEPTKAQHQAPQPNQPNVVNATTDSGESQEFERYTLAQIRQIFDYDAMVRDEPCWRDDIDSVMNVLHTVLNTVKATVRVAGEDKPSMVVIGKLVKLTHPEILYAIEMYREQTERIKNPTGYMLTLLYNAKEQMHLDITNQVQHDMAHFFS